MCAQPIKIYALMHLIGDLWLNKQKGQLDDRVRPYIFAHTIMIHSILRDVTDDEENLPHAV